MKDGAAESRANDLAASAAASAPLPRGDVGRRRRRRRRGTGRVMMCVLFVEDVVGGGGKGPEGFQFGVDLCAKFQGLWHPGKAETSSKAQFLDCDFAVGGHMSKKAP